MYETFYSFKTYYSMHWFSRSVFVVPLFLIFLQQVCFRWMYFIKQNVDHAVQLTITVLLFHLKKLTKVKSFETVSQIWQNLIKNLTLIKVKSLRVMTKTNAHTFNGAFPLFFFSVTSSLSDDRKMVSSSMKSAWNFSRPL